MTIQFTPYPAVNCDSSDPTLYGDIITHCKDWKSYADSSKYTTAHECTHGINNDLRLASGDWQGKNGFYVGKNRSIILNEPKFKKSDIAPFIPESLRSARYSLYVTGQTSWDDKPLYIYDEGVAYINGAWAAIELKEQENYVEIIPPSSFPSGYYRGLRHYDMDMDLQQYLNSTLPRGYPAPYGAGGTIVDGHIEFIPYMTAVLMRAAKADPTGIATVYDAIDKNLVDFSRWLFRHGTNAYYRCQKDGFPAFDTQDKLFATMKNGADYSTQRGFLNDIIGFVFPDGEVPEDDDQPIPWDI